MTKDQLWKIYTDKNPTFLQQDKQFVITQRGLKKLFDQTWDQAFESGRLIGKATAEKEKSLFDQIFGKLQ